MTYVCSASSFFVETPCMRGFTVSLVRERWKTLILLYRGQRTAHKGIGVHAHTRLFGVWLRASPV